MQAADPQSLCRRRLRSPSDSLPLPLLELPLLLLELLPESLLLPSAVVGWVGESGGRQGGGGKVVEGEESDGRQVGGGKRWGEERQEKLHCSCRGCRSWWSLRGRGGQAQR